MRRPGRWTLTAVMATREIRKRAANTADVLLTLHAQEQMAKRDIIAAEVFRILREGQVHDAPARDGEALKAIMELRMPGGRDAATVTVLAEGNRLVVVTVMWRDRP